MAVLPTTFPLPPVPPPVSAQRFDASGRATLIQATYEQALVDWLRRVLTALQT